MGLAEQFFAAVIGVIFIPLIWFFFFPVSWFFYMWFGCAHPAVALMLPFMAFGFFLAFYTDVNFRFPACALIILQMIATYIISEEESAIGALSLIIATFVIGGLCVFLWRRDHWNAPTIEEIKESAEAQVYRIRWANFDAPYKRREESKPPETSEKAE